MMRLFGAVLGLVVVFTSAAQAQTEAEVKFFETKIRPIFASKCSACHGEKVRMASLQLTIADGLFKGADSGPVVVKGDPKNSRLIQVVSYEGKIKMPPTGRLEDEEIQSLRDWVKMGAPWPPDRPDGTASSSHSASSNQSSSQNEKRWAFEPVKDYAPPDVKNREWVQSPIDNFILAKLEEKGLAPAAPADKLTLLRRAKFDLHGLPPREQEIREFLADTAPGAFARLVDRLLDSPHYGEQSGRHWLDVARYADPNLNAWRYRDYVIEAFNRDLPYDQFIKEQLAGDLLAAEKSEVNTRGIVATGFIALGPKSSEERDKIKMVYDTVDESIDTTSKAFLGLTIACARCHDHKFDPISTKDYYSLASIFASTKVFEKIEPTRLYYRPLVPQDVYERYQNHDHKVKGKAAQIDALLEMETIHYRDRLLDSRLADYMVAARRVRLESVTPEDVARQADLDPETLKKWVEYLKPGFRPFLQKWYTVDTVTDAAAVRSLAEEYQQSFQATAKAWGETLQKWSNAVDDAVRAGAAPPGKPEFEAFKDRFFAEVSLAYLTYEEGIQNGPFAVQQPNQENVVSAQGREQLLSLRKELEPLKATSPPEPAMASAIAEGEVVEQAVFLRGSYQNHGDLVTKRFPAILAGSDPPPVTSGSGRRELADWLTQPGHPLTSRVMVNRLWQWHFSEGLVRTPNNFGATGERPTHPELLDYLARQFVRDGWSVKRMHRLIMLSSTYQMSSWPTDEQLKLDADNRLLSRFNRRRLNVEEMRDAFLELDGSLDLTVGGQVNDPVLSGTDEFARENSRINADDYQRRTLYLPLHRNKLPTLLSLFDFGDAYQSLEKRAESNIAPQALYLANSGFVHDRAGAFAKFLLAGDQSNDAARLERAYLIALGRKPKSEELQSALRFIEKYPAKQTADADRRMSAWQSFCKMLMISNEFHYVD